MKVDFYLLATTSVEGLILFACELLEAGYKQKNRYYVHTDSEAMGHQLDEHLWSFKEISFVPHQLIGEGAMHPSPVLIGHGSHSPIPKTQPILMNLASEVPPFYRQFRSVIDITQNDENALVAARARFKFYKTNGCALQYYDCRKIGVDA